MATSTTMHNILLFPSISNFLTNSSVYNNISYETRNSQVTSSPVVDAAGLDVADNNTTLSLFNNSNHSNQMMLPFPTTPSSRGRGPFGNADITTLDWLLMYLEDTVMPAALSVGVIGSLILVFTFTMSPLRYNALAHYLTAIGVSDLLYLTSCLLVWIASRGNNFYLVVGVCQMTTFTLLLSRFLGTWYLLCAHVERFLVFFGLCRTRVWCSTFRTKCTILVIFVFSLVGFSHYMWTHVVEERYGMRMCTFMLESLQHKRALDRVEIVTALFLPMLLIILIDVSLCVAMIVKQVSRTLRVESKAVTTAEVCPDGRGDYSLASSNGCQTVASTAGRCSGDPPPPPPEFDMARERAKTTLTVVILGIVFIGLLLPSNIIRARDLFGTKRVGMNIDEIRNMKLFEQIVKFNSVYKLFLYVVMMKTFRHGFVDLVTCRSKRRTTSESLEETTV